MISDTKILMRFAALLPLIQSISGAMLPLFTDSIPVPVVIWHGLGDKFDNPGLVALKTDLEARVDLKGIFVHIIQIGEDGTKDQRATFFGSANAQVALVCEQLLSIPEITSPTLNPSGKFDAIGFSQGGQLLRAVVERCGGEGGLNVRNLITVGSQHMGISALPPCPPGSSPFSSCRLLHLGLVREGLYSNYAQRNLIPAQYFREEARIDEYLSINTFLKDINNERKGDQEVGPLPTQVDSMRRMNEGEDEEQPRNATYKKNFASLTNLVLLRFSLDQTVVPVQSAHFTLPSPSASNCPDPDPSCYLTPVPYSSLPLYSSDYIGLKQLDKRGAMHLGVCEGEHMQIDEECWEGVVSWLGVGDGVVRSGSSLTEKLVWQL